MRTQGVVRRRRRVRKERVLGSIVFLALFLLIAARLGGQTIQALSAKKAARVEETKKAGLERRVRELTEESQRLNTPDYIKQISKEKEFLAEPNEVPIILYGADDSAADPAANGSGTK